MTAYYNEYDPEKVEALRHLMREGWIAPGVVDTKDIRDVTPDELSGFAQCHFFAGIGLWSVAARAAGIPDDFPFWSGSCPCQPFSSAGAGEGTADDRHLWPHWYWLIAVCRPDAVVGEQVASKDGLAWIDLVSADMEGSAYAGGALDLCSAGFGAPNIRQRLFMLWLADEQGRGCGELRGTSVPRESRYPDGDLPRRTAGGLADGLGQGCLCGSRLCHCRSRQHGRVLPAHVSSAGRLVDSIGAGLEGHTGHGDHCSQPGWDGTWEAGSVATAGNAGGLGNASHDRFEQGRRSLRPAGNDGPVRNDERLARPLRDQVRGPANGFWSGADWLLCRDPDGPKLRPVEPGTFCLAPGYPGRAGELRAYGDAINPQVATQFLKAVWPEMKGLS